LTITYIVSGQKPERACHYWLGIEFGSANVEVIIEYFRGFRV
jgi:hypothetical protein